jgi:hypothetical protein
MNYYKTFFLICMSCTLAYGCTDAGKKKAEMPVVKENTVKTDNSAIVAPSKSDTIYIDVRDGKGKLKVRKKVRQHLYFVFDSHDFKEITATLSSDGPHVNVRFTRIIMPNGEMDGPFGTTISRELPVNGRYMLDVHENEMAGEPWTGDFEINISLSK